MQINNKQQVQANQKHKDNITGVRRSRQMQNGE
jgi:hypothetical protein